MRPCDAVEWQQSPPAEAGNNGGPAVGGCTSFDPVRGGYGDTSEPDCELCDPDNEDDCETCEVDDEGDTTCVPDCGDPTCCGGPTETINFNGSGVPLAAGGTPPPGSPAYVNTVTIEAEGNPAADDASYSWSTGSSSISLSNVTSSTFSSTVTVTGLVASTNNMITVSYSVSGQSTSQSVSINVQQPSSMGNPQTSFNAACPTCGSGEAGWEKDITWTVMDQSHNPIQFALPTYDTLANETPNSCSAPAVGDGTAPGKTTNSQGQWLHKYKNCSTACVNGGSCSVTGTQSYFVNGFQINVSYTMTCTSIKVEGN